MKKWMIIGGIVTVAIVGVTALGIVATRFIPTVAQAQFSPVARMAMAGGNFADRFEGRGPAPMEQAGFPGGPDWGRGNIDRDALLAEALGITVEELQAARQEADLAAVQQMLDEGWLGQNQADLMTAQIQLRDYIDRDALLAEVLGVTVEEVQTARTGGTMATLIDGSGLEPVDLRTNMEAAYQAVLDQAVTDGVITQEQADLLPTGRMPGGFDGDFGRPQGPGGFDRSQRPDGRFGGMPGGKDGMRW